MSEKISIYERSVVRFHDDKLGDDVMDNWKEIFETYRPESSNVKKWDNKTIREALHRIMLCPKVTITEVMEILSKMDEEYYTHEELIRDQTITFEKN